MLAGEKPGGHSERSIAIGTIEVALWDAVAKIEGLPLYRSLANRYSGGAARERMFVYVGRRLVPAGQRRSPISATRSAATWTPATGW